MKQKTLATMTGLELYTKKAWRPVFLEEMEQVVPWRELGALIEPYYPQAGNGRPAIGIHQHARRTRDCTQRRCCYKGRLKK